MNCLDCNVSMKDYFDESSCFTEYVCYVCGNYASNSPAYLSNPDQFKNLIRNNPQILQKIINRNLTERRSNRGFDSALIRYG